jgi:phage terminase large subunit-like protein
VPPGKPLTRAERNIRWCEEHLCLPEGSHIGRKLTLPDFMRQDFRAIYDNPAGTRRAIISRGRKNAKTSECAFLLLLHLCGREAKLNSQLYSCAQSRDQAAVLFSIAAKIVRLSPTLRPIVQIRDTAKELLCPELGTAYKALSAEASTALGRNPSFTVFDETGQVQGPRSEFYEAMEMATAAQEAPLTVIISTQASSDNDLLSALIDDALAGNDPTVVLRFDTAPKELDPFSEEAIKAANPAFDVFMNKREVMSMAADAQRLPAREAPYRNFVLNQRVDATTSPFLATDIWQACADEPRDFRGCEVFAGLDLSESGDLTALALAHCEPTTGVWHVHMVFWLPTERLMRKSTLDREPYDLWARRGFLELTPGAAVDYEWVAERLKSVFDEYRIKKIAFDRWNFQHLRPCLSRAGFSEALLTQTFVEFGQGYQSMSPAIRATETLILNKKLRHGSHPVLNMCAANSVIESDAAGNRKLTKKRSRGRIDGMVALMMAIGVAPSGWTSPIDVQALIG